MRGLRWPDWVCALRRRVGRRGAFLLALWLVDYVYAYTLVCPPESEEIARRRQYLADAIPIIKGVNASMNVWAGMWILVGTLCLINAFRVRDLWGYGPAAAIKVAWIAGNIAAALQGYYPQGIQSATSWFAVAAGVLVISTLPEPATPIAEVARRYDEAHPPEPDGPAQEGVRDA